MRANQVTNRFETFWKQGNKKGTYRTKTLTGFHKRIHDSPQTDYARTIEIMPAIDWPLGLYSEVIAITDKKNPNKNKSFEN